MNKIISRAADATCFILLSISALVFITMVVMIFIPSVPVEARISSFVLVVVIILASFRK